MSHSVTSATQCHLCHILWPVDRGHYLPTLPTPHPISPAQRAESTLAQDLSFGRGFYLWLPTIHWKIHYVGGSARLKGHEPCRVFSSLSDPPLYPGNHFLTELESGPGHASPKGTWQLCCLHRELPARLLFLYAQSEAPVWDNLALSWWPWELSVWLQCSSPDAQFPNSPPFPSKWDLRGGRVRGILTQLPGWGTWPEGSAFPLGPAAKGIRPCSLSVTP